MNEMENFPMFLGIYIKRRKNKNNEKKKQKIIVVQTMQ